jgi:hypothetical protein
MGGSSFYFSTFTQAALSAMESANVDVTAASSLDFLAHSTADITQDSHYQDWLTYNSSKRSSSAHGIPAPAPSCGGDMCSDFSAWSSQIQALDGTGPGPFPLDMSLVGISDLLTSKFFPNDPNITRKQSGLLEYLNTEYCGQVPNCGPPQSPSPTPVPTPVWAMKGYNAQHTGLAENVGPVSSTVHVAWRFQTGESINSSPTIGADGIVYFGR